MHAKYVAFSQSLYNLLPLKDLVKEVTSVLDLPNNFSTITKSTVFEDNKGAITIATFPHLSLTSKHIAVKYHWFREHIRTDFEIEYAKTNKQIADLFTKGLQESQFFNLQ